MQGTVISYGRLATFDRDLWRFSDRNTQRSSRDGMRCEKSDVLTVLQTGGIFIVIYDDKVGSCASETVMRN